MVSFMSVVRQLVTTYVVSDLRLVGWKYEWQTGRNVSERALTVVLWRQCGTNVLRP